MNFKYLLIILHLIPNSLYAAHILSIFGIPIPTQYAFIEPLLKELASRGHQITSITNYPQKDRLNNFRDVVVKNNTNLFVNYYNFTLDNIQPNYYEVMDEIFNSGIRMCVNIQNDTTFRHIMENEQIDLIILDVIFSESFFGLGELLRAPMVGTCSMSTKVFIDELVGNISPMSYIPHVLLPLKEMSFYQRLLNVIIHFVEWSHYNYKYLPIQKQLYDLYYPNAQMSFEEAQKNFSLVLLNDHFSLTTPRPYVPNMIEVAGLNVVTNPEPIKPHIKHILDKARNGAILMNLDVFINPRILDIILKQFSSMSQIILWKTSQKISHRLSNLYVNANFSESSILTHPNIQLYITSGSYLSILDSIYHGLPILGISSVEYQYNYVDFIKKFGNGLSIKLNSISERILVKTFNELLTSSHYRNVAKSLSYRFRDQQTTPMERAVYWIEYVLRHNGAAHLRNMGQNLNWWQFYNIDVIILIFLLSGLLISLALLLLKIMITFLWNSKKWKRIITKKKD